MEPGASNDPPDPHQHLLFVALWWRGFKALLSQCVPFSLIGVGRVSPAYVVSWYPAWPPHTHGTAPDGTGLPSTPMPMQLLSPGPVSSLATKPSCSYG
eukprot:1157393-Pelagomonas_calceolata.AAC.9